MGSTFRRTLIRTIRHFILRPAHFFAVVAVSFAIVAAVLLVPTFVSGGTLPSFSVGLPRPGGEPLATEEFMRGNREYNAELVWRSFNDEARERLRAQGGSVESIQAQMQAARDRGLKVENISYIGGRDLPDGTSMQFYLVGYRASSRADLEYVPYLFTLDRGGKIAKVQ
jgi:hypothetical protein